LWIEGLVMRPLRRLARAMNRASEGDFLVRVEGSRRKDELGKLADSFNRLLARITALQADEVDVQRDLSESQQHLNFQQTFNSPPNNGSSTPTRCSKSGSTSSRCSTRSLDRSPPHWSFRSCSPESARTSPSDCRFHNSRSCSSIATGRWR